MTLYWPWWIHVGFQLWTVPVLSLVFLPAELRLFAAADSDLCELLSHLENMQMEACVFDGGEQITADMALF